MLAAFVSACGGWLAAVAHARATPSSAGVIPRSPHRAAEGCADENLLPSQADLGVLESATLCLINRERLGHHLKPLRANHELHAVARSQLAAMVRLDYFSDVRPSGRTPMSLVSATRYPARAARYSVGENLAWGSHAESTPASIVSAWMASPPHREVMLTREYTDAGVAASPTVPSFLGLSGVAGIYALELGSRRR